MKRISTFGILLLLTLLLAGCSADALMDRGASILDGIFAGDRVRPIAPSDSEPEPDSESGQTPDPEPVLEPAGPVAEEPDILDSIKPVVPDNSNDPPAAEPAPSQPAPAPSSVPSQPAASTSPEEVTPSHTDITFFSAGESIRYLPKGVTGAYACEYTSGNDQVATVDDTTGKVTAVGPGTTKVKMHVESSGQYDFECIVRCNWEDSQKAKNDEPSLPPAPSASDKPAASSKPAASEEPSGATEDGVSASHSDATFFNPKEHFRLLPVGAGDDYTSSYSTSNKDVAKVDEKGVVTAVGPGTATVTMVVDCGGNEYTFPCTVRCKW